MSTMLVNETIDYMDNNMEIAIKKYECTLYNLYIVQNRIK